MKAEEKVCKSACKIVYREVMLTWKWIGQILGKKSREQKETELDILWCVKEGEALSGMQNNFAISALKPCLGLLLGWGPAPHTICWLPFQMVNEMWVVDEAPWRERVSIQSPTFGFSRVPAGGGMGCRPHQALDESLLITKMGWSKLGRLSANRGLVAVVPRRPPMTYVSTETAFRLDQHKHFQKNKHLLRSEVSWCDQTSIDLHLRRSTCTSE